jgi:hypothetical protein
MENINSIIPREEEIFSSPKHTEQLWCTPRLLFGGYRAPFPWGLKMLTPYL